IIARGSPRCSISSATSSSSIGSGPRVRELQARRSTRSWCERVVRQVGNGRVLAEPPPPVLGPIRLAPGLVEGDDPPTRLGESLPFRNRDLRFARLHLFVALDQ